MLRGKYPLLIALVLGTIAGLLAYSAIKVEIRRARDGWEVQRILCSTQELSEGTELDEDMVAVCETPERFVTDSFIRVGPDDDGAANIPWGRKLIIPLKKGDALLYSQFDSRTEFPLDQVVPKQARAVSIEVSEKSAVNQLVQPNNHVDILVTLREPDGKEPVTTTLVQNVIVLATGRVTGQNLTRSEEDRHYTHVALLVTPEEAEQLVLAQEIGSLALSLRNPDDPAARKIAAKTTVADLFPNQVGRDPPVRPFQHWEPCVFKGTNPCEHAPIDQVRPRGQQ